MRCRILVVGSVPLAAPWNGADKNLARLLVRLDSLNQYIVHTSLDEAWPAPPHVTAVRSRFISEMPTTAQKVRALGFLLRRTGSVDLIHVIASLSQPPTWIAPLLRTWANVRHRPIVHTVPSLGDRPIDRRTFFGDVTVVFSEHSEQRLIRNDIRGVVRIYPPLDSETLAHATQPGGLVRELDLGPFAVLYPGHYGDGSGIREVIEAFAALPPELDRAVLVLACRAHAWQDPIVEARSALQLATAAGINERVRIVGNVRAMPALISACAVTVLVPATLGSKMDLPLVVLESLFLERPVIISDAPPMREALLGGGGFTVRYGDIPALTRAIGDLLLDPGLRAQLGRQARPVVMEHCDPLTVVQRYQEIYASCLRSSERDRR